MENENVTITLTVAQWNAVLGALSTVPFNVYQQVSSVIDNIRLQAAPQIDELAKKYPPPSDNDVPANPS